MGSVLAFVPREAAAKKPLPAGDIASIVIFPGVRYERYEPETDRAATGGRKSRRDKKAL